MHRAGVLRSFRHRRRFRPIAEIFCRLRCEFRLASSRTEIEALALVPEKVLRDGAVDAHAADGIGGRQIFPRLGDEFLAAALAAEMEDLAAMSGRRLAGSRIDNHPADRIAGDSFRGGRSCFRRAATAMRVMIVAGMGHAKSLCVSISRRR
ncbi:hypothetical protein MESS2_1050037 [Mesorhizobium metallidurans STM 2683]|uniref:Uncharacterized protein n=1 Tax=Mesorhizobium metallidurans STM 2683 TaxID=1297569 RepID=M5EH28_9HYPH|nr:hypothetical protein MESS2_1050037 [Mesorhizobium metallidurans STM 2683]